MVWKALEALGMLSEALGSLVVNTVCPLPGSWINHVVCIFTWFSKDEVTFVCMFTVFSDCRLMEMPCVCHSKTHECDKSLVLFRSFFPVRA